MVLIINLIVLCSFLTNSIFCLVQANSSFKQPKNNDLKLTKFFNRGIMQQVWETLIEHADEIDITNWCKKSLLQTLTGMEDGSLWAFQCK